MANAPLHADNIARTIHASLTQQLAKADTAFCVQKKAIAQGNIDSLESSMRVIREVIDTLAAYKRTLSANIGDRAVAQGAAHGRYALSVLTQLEEKAAEFAILQRQNRALLAERTKEMAMQLNEVRSFRADVVGDSFPAQTQSTLVDAEA